VLAIFKDVFDEVQVLQLFMWSTRGRLLLCDCGFGHSARNNLISSHGFYAQIGVAKWTECSNRKLRLVDEVGDDGSLSS
jgi:hypothetical protein